MSPRPAPGRAGEVSEWAASCVVLVISEMEVGKLTGNEQDVVLKVLVRECLEPAQVAMLINVNVADAKDASFPPGKVGVHGIPLRAPPPVSLE